jgi:hypothetical protein
MSTFTPANQIRQSERESDKKGGSQEAMEREKEKRRN